MQDDTVKIAMVKNKTGFALTILSITTAILLSLVAVSFLALVRTSSGYVADYSAKVFTRWANTAGVYISEEILHSADFDNCYTQDSNGISVTPSNADLPVATTHYSITATPPHYNVSITLPNELSDVDISVLQMIIQGSTMTKPIVLTSQCDGSYKGKSIEFHGNLMHYLKTYMSDFAYYADMGPEHVDFVPLTTDGGNSRGIHINGFWNIQPPYWMASYEPVRQEVKFIANEIEVGGYLRVTQQRPAGTNVAGTSFGNWTWGEGNTNQYLREIQLVDPANLGNLINVPKDFFRLKDPGNSEKTYMDYGFEDPTSGSYGVYKNDLNYWNNWRDNNNVTTWFRDRAMGAKDFSFTSMPTGQDIFNTLVSRCNKTITAPSGSNATVASLRLKAQSLANQLNAEYGIDIATPRVIVNFFRGDITEYAVEINMEALTSSLLLNNLNNRIYIKPASVSDIHKLSVVLTNGSDLTGIHANDEITILVEGAVYINGNINTVGTGPILTIISRDEVYILSGALAPNDGTPILNRMYIGTELDECNYDIDTPSGMEQYVADKLCIINPAYADHVNSVYTSCEKRIPYSWVVNYWKWKNGTGPEPSTLDEKDVANGQYWMYHDTPLLWSTPGSSPDPDPNSDFNSWFKAGINPYYKKRIPAATNTTVNATIVNPASRPMPNFEGWGVDTEMNFIGSMVLVNTMRHNTYYRNAKSWGGNVEQTWVSRVTGNSSLMGVTNLYPCASHSTVTYWHNAVSSGGGKTSQSYDNRLTTTPSAVTLDTAVRIR